MLAVACTGLAWGGHALWAGSPVALGAFVPATVLMAMLLARFTLCQRGFGEIFTVLAAAQVGLHLVFHSLSAVSPTVAAGHAAHTATPHQSAPLTHALGPLGVSPGMLAGHLWAALLAAALLAYGELCLWTLLRLLTAALPALLRPAVRPIPGPRTGAPDPTPARRSPRMLRRERTRGPPLPAERLQLAIDALRARPHTI
ncbi:hypothetical protein GCM10009799_06580 [Nocardiopsis rhodophaea]|uniref:Integral membrane protein n=2 Tax=Nocardiopsis rhodophaea TaxID=280238 RepID=A0ABN2SCV8_9ACTN